MACRYAWKQEVLRSKRVKFGIRRALKRRWFASKRKAIGFWLGFVEKSRLNDLRVNWGELNDEKAEMNQQINFCQSKIERSKAIEAQLQARIQKAREQRLVNATKKCIRKRVYTDLCRWRMAPVVIDSRGFGKILSQILTDYNREVT